MKNSLGPTIGMAPFSRDAIDRLWKLGIATMGQLIAVLTDSWGERQARTVLDVSLEEAQRRVRGIYARESTLDPRMAGSGFLLPPVAGILRQDGNVPEIRAHRRQSRENRKKVTAHLKHLIKKEDLPGRVLLREKAWVAPVRDQLDLPTCVGFTSTENREFLRGLPLSPGFGYLVAKSEDGQPEVAGSRLFYAFLGMAKVGQVRESDCPYTKDLLSIDLEPYRRKAREFRIDGFADLMLDQEEMHMMPLLLKAVLAGKFSPDLGGQPVSVSLAVTDSWRSMTTRLYGLITLPAPGEAVLGGHALDLEGYIDAEDEHNPLGIDLFVLKNSWGQEFAAQNPLGPDYRGYALAPASLFQDRALIWESVLCLAEPSPARSADWLDLLRVAWKPGSSIFTLGVRETLSRVLTTVGAAGGSPLSGNGTKFKEEFSDVAQLWRL